jgi:hypothetical protein
MLDHVLDASFVDDASGVWLMADDDGLRFRMKEFSAGSAVRELFIANVLQDGDQLVPGEIGRRGYATQPLKRLPLLRHANLALRVI